jgi:hypothetical protein
MPCGTWPLNIRPLNFWPLCLGPPGLWPFGLLQFRLIAHPPGTAMAWSFAFNFAAEDFVLLAGPNFRSLPWSLDTPSGGFAYHSLYRPQERSVRIIRDPQAELALPSFSCYHIPVRDSLSPFTSLVADSRKGFSLLSSSGTSMTWLRPVDRTSGTLTLNAGTLPCLAHHGTPLSKRCPTTTALERTIADSSWVRQDQAESRTIGVSDAIICTGIGWSFALQPSL